MHPLIEKLHELKKSLEVEGADAFTINLEIATVTERLRYELALAGRERPRTKKRTLKEINGALRYTSGRGEAIAKAFERKREEKAKP